MACEILARQKPVAKNECDNCGQSLGKLQKARRWGTSMVCGNCYRALAEEAYAAGAQHRSQGSSHAHHHDHDRNRHDERIRAFCRWLPPRYAEVLRDHFNHPEPDWANCAYQNYLAKAQEPVLRLRWNQVRDLSAGQAELLDRRLFAPERVRPAAVIEDIQTVEGDLRLRDPFNHRAF